MKFSWKTQYTVGVLGMNLGQKVGVGGALVLFLAAGACDASFVKTDGSGVSYFATDGWSVSNMAVSAAAGGSQNISFTLNTTNPATSGNPFSMTFNANTANGFTNAINFAVTVVNNSSAAISQMVVQNSLTQSVAPFGTRHYSYFKIPENDPDGPGVGQTPSPGADLELGYAWVQTSEGTTDWRPVTAFFGGVNGGGFNLAPGQSMVMNFTVASRHSTFRLDFTANPEPGTIVLASIVVAVFGALCYKRRRELAARNEDAASAIAL